MSNNIENMGSVGVFTKDLGDLSCNAFELNREGFPLDYVKDVLGAVSRYVASAKASGYSALVEFNMAMYRPACSELKDSHIRLAVSNVAGAGCNCHSVAYYEVDGESKKIESQSFKLEDVLAYLENEESAKAA